MRGATGGQSRASRWVAVLSVVSILGWAVPAVVMLGKGFAVEDEGSYLLAYRFWHVNPYYVSGAQYVYGPLFEAVGESIPMLRLLRLVGVLATNAWLAWCFVAWLGRQGLTRLPASRASLVLLVTASGGMTYLWTPLSPGYHALTADVCLVLVSLLLLTLTGNRQPWVAALSGVGAVVLVVTKWTAFPVAVLTIGAALWVAGHTSRVEAVRHAALVLCGVLAALLALQLWFVPLGRFVSTLWHVSSLTAVGSHGLLYLARANVATTGLLLLASVTAALPLVAGFYGARRAAARGSDTVAQVWLWGAGACTLLLVLPVAVGWRGGSNHERAFAGAFGALLVACLAGAAYRRGPLPGGSSGRLLAAVLAVVPLLQAAGTNVPLLYVAAECLAMWTAAVLMLACRERGPEIVTTAVLVDLAVLVVVTAMITSSSTLMNPFKTSSVVDATTIVPSLGVRLDPATARQYAALVAAVGPHVVPDRTPVLTLDQNAGLTYLLRGVPAGSTWTDAASPSRTAGILELACREGDVAAAPVLVVDRPVDPALRRALAGCGFDYPAGYRELAVPDGPPGLRVFVPRP